jgi:uncharacterized membrane protein
MQNWQKIDKHRLSIFTDAIIAIIMTILVLDLKVPIGHFETDHDLAQQLIKQLPHFWGFAISFSMIVSIWFSHHDLMAYINQPDRTFATLNFIFTGFIATLPFTTALVSEYPSRSLAVSVLAGNLFLMNVFLTSLFIYREKKKLGIADSLPIWYATIKKKMGIFGVLLLLLAIFIAFLSPRIALLMIVAVPLMHCIPVREKKRKV